MRVGASACTRGATTAQDSSRSRCVRHPRRRTPGSGTEFAAGDVTPWTYVDVGTVFAPSIWIVAGGKLRQTSNLLSMPVAGVDPDRKGTCEVAGSSSWSNVVIQVRLEAHDNDAIGFMFRFIDDDNYYRFSMDRERGYRRLVRKEKGVFEVLWEDDFALPELARSYLFTIIADSEELRDIVDGVPMFVVEDEQARSR